MHRGTGLLLVGDWLAAWKMNPLNLLLPGGLVLYWFYCLAVVAGWQPPWKGIKFTAAQGRIIRGSIVLILAALWIAVIAGTSGRP
jgi:hypothetical protein